MNPGCSLLVWSRNRGTLTDAPPLNLSLAGFSGFGSLHTSTPPNWTEISCAGPAVHAATERHFCSNRTGEK